MLSMQANAFQRRPSLTALITFPHFWSKILSPYSYQAVF